MGSQHPSPNVKTFCNFEPQTWPEMITSRDAESTCFEGSRTSCDVIYFWHFLGQIVAGKDHITWWMLPADKTLSLGYVVFEFALSLPLGVVLPNILCEKSLGPFELEEGKRPPPHTFNLTKKIARFTRAICGKNRQGGVLRQSGGGPS